MTDDDDYRITAEYVLRGHVDDVRTFLALVVALNGVINELENAVNSLLSEATAEGASDEVARHAGLVALARRFDGMDGAVDIPALRAALIVLIERRNAIGYEYKEPE